MLALIALIAFASNSLLCRIALRETSIDAATFTSVRIISGALVLAAISLVRKTYSLKPNAYSLKPKANSQSSGFLTSSGQGLSAFALFTYAAAFSFSYRDLSASTGALLLFGAVQISMMSYGLFKREKYSRLQWVGFVIATAGVLAMLLPGFDAPPFFGAVLMITAGIAWGVFSIRGKKSGDPIQSITESFIRAVPFTAVLSVAMLGQLSIDTTGIWLAVASGALASGLGYVVWYAVLSKISSNVAASIQLSVPILVALGAVLFLGEVISMRLIIASVVVLGGLTLVVRSR